MPALQTTDSPQYVVTINNGRINIDRIITPPLTAPTLPVLADGLPHQAIDMLVDILVSP